MEFPLGHTVFPSSRADFCLCHCLRGVLFQNEAIWAYLCSTAWQNRGIAGHTHLRPVLKAVGCLTSSHVGCLVSHFLGRELENTGNSSIKKTSISIACMFWSLGFIIVKKTVNCVETGCCKTSAPLKQ